MSIEKNDPSSTSIETELDDELPFGRLLRFWRNLHHLSQEEFAFRLDSSPRHISRLENGRVHPSKKITLRIADLLSMTERDRNLLLVAAGYSPASRQLDFHSPNLRWLRKTMTFKLKATEPYPSFLTDGQANILMVNRSWIGFCRQVFSEERLAKVSNYFDLLFDKASASGIINASDDVLSVIIMSLQQSAIIRDDAMIQSMVERLESSPNAPKDWRERAAKIEPATSFPIELNVSGEWHKFFDIIQSVSSLGPAAYVSEPNFIMHTLYPEDESVDLSDFVQEGLTHPLLY